MNFYQITSEKHRNDPNTAVSFLYNNLNVKTYSYKDVFVYVEKYAERLQKLGITEGYKVALAFQNSIEWVTIYLALTKIKAVTVLVDMTLPKVELNELLKNTEVNAVITNKDVYQKLTDLEIACFDAFNNLREFNKYVVSALIDDYLLENNVEHILFSSGTTSVPSGIMHKPDSLINTTYDCLNENHINDDKQRYMGLLPFSHIYGLLVQLYAAFLSGSQVMLFESLNAQTLMKCFEDFKPTFIGAVPKICELLKTKIEQQAKAQKKDKILKKLVPICFKIREKTGINLGRTIFKSVHNAFGGEINLIPCAGAPIAEDTAKFFLGLGFNLIITYGTTETNIPVSGARNGNFTYDTVGVPYPNMNIKISPDGEVLIKGSYSMVGYYRNEELTNKVMKDGYFKSGDIGYLDKKNRIKITGRSKENIILPSGKKVFPENLEKEFYKLKEIVEEYAICGKTIENQEYSEIHLFIVGAKDEKQAENMVKEINQTLPSYMHIQNVHFIDSIPKTNLDKIKRFALLDKIQEKKVEEIDESKMTFEEEVIYYCLKIAKVDEDYRTIPRTTKIFQDLGLDSLSTVSFLLELENRYKLDLSQYITLSKDITIQEFLEFLKTAPKTE